VAARLGSPRINLLPRAALGEWPAPAGAATVGVRAEHLLVHAEGAAPLHRLRAEVHRIEILSDQRLVQLTDPRRIYSDPDDVYVAQRLGSPRINLLPAGSLPETGAPAAAHTIGIRTEHVTVSPTAADGVPGKVVRIEHLGDQSHLHISFADLQLTLLVDPQSPLRPGDNIGLKLRDPLYFDATGRRLRAA
jgi:multiple sugar transport system ATP-binding protein